MSIRSLVGDTSSVSRANSADGIDISLLVGAELVDIPDVGCNAVRMATQRLLPMERCAPTNTARRHELPSLFGA